MTNDERAFMQAIIAAPDDDAPRLIFADWLVEYGDAPRAEFIQVQCELAKLDESWEAKYNRNQLPADHPIMKRQNSGRGMSKEALAKLMKYDQRDTELRWSAKKLWSQLPTCKVFAPWASGISIHPEQPQFWIGNQDGPLCIVRRGFIAEVRCTLQQWLGGETCNVCHNNRTIPANLCKRCHGSGTIPGIGPVLVMQQPVTRVVTEKRTSSWDAAGGRGQRFSWMNEEQRQGRGWDDACCLPRRVFALLDGWEREGDPFLLSRRYLTEQAARDALECRALIRHAKHQNERSK